MKKKKKHSKANAAKVRSNKSTSSSVIEEIPTVEETPVEESENITEDAVNETANEAALSDTLAEEPTAKTERAFPWQIIITLGIAALSAIALLSAVVLYVAFPRQSEIGDQIHHSAEGLPYCELLTDLFEIDSGVLGKHKVDFKLFGFLPISSTLSVVDTVSPQIEVHPIAISPSYSPIPEEFIESAVDKTALTYEFVTDKTGKKLISVTDEGGNISFSEYKIVHNGKLMFSDIELGTTPKQLQAIINAAGISQPDLSGIDFSTCGTYRAGGIYDNMLCRFEIKITDTKFPYANVYSCDLLMGQTLNAEDFAYNVTDASSVSVSFKSEPSFMTPGVQNLTVILEDSSGNTTRYGVTLNIHSVPSEMAVEAGTTTEEFAAKLQEYFGEDADSVLTLPEDFACEKLKIGTHTVELIGKYSTANLALTVEDTIAPVLVLKDVSAYLGNVPEIEQFIKEFSDHSDVEFAFETAPDASVEGDFEVTVIATDAAGNITTATAIMHVTTDDLPPVIYGVKPLSVYEGGSISYRSGVYALDAKDGRISVTANAAHVNINVPGTYYVYYTASDSTGNSATAKTTVTVKPADMDAVNALADRILATIITPEMTAREKAHAIYTWSRNNIKYSTTTSHLMGYFDKAAYSGFTKHYGNCYTYYAVTSTLLTRVGINNAQIQRNSIINPHYWNLVELDGSWYHLDTCPQPAPHRLKVFLLTTDELHTFPLSYYYSFNESQFPATP